MPAPWVEAGGADQLALMGAASRAVGGDVDVPCPLHDGERLRFYFHRLSELSGTGTMWAWCPSARIFTHIPRVKPAHSKLRDPFEDLTIEQFAKLEVDPRTRFYDRLDRLWEDGEIVRT